MDCLNHNTHNVLLAIDVLKYIRHGIGEDSIASFWGNVVRKGIHFCIMTHHGTTQGDAEHAYTAMVEGRESVTTRYPSASLALAISNHPEENLVEVDAEFLSASGECCMIVMPQAVAAALNLVADCD